MANIVILVGGDSQAGSNFLLGANVSPTNSNEYWVDPSFVNNVGNGQISLANQIVALTGDTVQIINGATNAAGITLVAGGAGVNWQDSVIVGGSLMLALVNDWSAASIPSPAIMYFYAGGVDAIAAIPENDVLIALGDLITNLQFVWPGVKLVLSPLARNEQGLATDDEWNAVNSAIRRAIDFYDDIFGTADLTDLILKDGLHISNNFPDTGAPPETIKQGFRAGSSVVAVLGLGTPPVDISPRLIRIEQQSATEVLLGFDQDIIGSGFIAGIFLSDDDFVTPVTPTDTNILGSTMQCIVPAMSTSAEIKCRIQFGTDDYDPATQQTASNADGLPLGWADARSLLFAGLHPDDKSVGDLTVTLTSSVDRSSATSVQRVFPGTGETQVITLGFNGKVNTLATAQANLFLVEGDTADFTGTAIIPAQVSSFTVTGPLVGDIQPYEFALSTPYVMEDGKFYSAAINNASAAQDQTAISKSDMVDNGGLSFSLNADATSTTNGDVPTDFTNTFSFPLNQDTGLVIWSEYEYIVGLAFGTGSPTLTTPYTDQSNLIGSTANINLTSNYTGATIFTVTGLPAGLSSANGLVTGTVTAPAGAFVVTVVSSIGSFVAPAQTFIWYVLTAGSGSTTINSLINSSIN